MAPTTPAGSTSPPSNLIRRQRIPVHTVGFGRERLDRDVEITKSTCRPARSPDSRVSAQVSLRQSGYSGRSARLKVMAGTSVLAVARRHPEIRGRRADRERLC